jgi:hypothetical protein
MWPSGKARVCKALYGGSNPPVTSQVELVFGKQSLEGVYVHTPLYLFWTLSFPFLTLPHVCDRTSPGRK